MHDVQTKFWEWATESAIRLAVVVVVVVRLVRPQFQRKEH